MAEYVSPEWHPAFEEYCETIFELREDDVDVIQARIAERLSVSRPAVSEMIKRMEVEGLVALDGHRIDLTPAGRKLAERVVRKHRIIERLLTDFMGYTAAEAHVYADDIGETFSDDMVERMEEKLGNPERCAAEEPVLRDIRPGQQAACHYSEEITPQMIEVVSRTADAVATAEPAAG